MKKQNRYALEALTRLKHWRVIVIAEQKPELVHVHKMIANIGRKQNYGKYMRCMFNVMRRSQVYTHAQDWKHLFSNHCLRMAFQRVQATI